MPWDVKRRTSGATAAESEPTLAQPPSTGSAGRRKGTRQPVTARGRSAKRARVTGLVMQTEAQLQTAVIDLARMYGWKTAHFRAAKASDGAWMTPLQGDAKGFPDLTLVRRDRLIFAELKSASGKLDAEGHQQAWLDAFRNVAEVYVWRPNDIHDIAVILAA